MAGATAAAGVVKAGAAGAGVVALGSVNALVPAVAVAGAAAEGTTAVVFDFCSSFSNTFLDPELDCRECSTDKIKHRPRKVAAVYLVICVSAVPEPAPNKASVVPPPNAAPMPASFFGN